jgi:hypothetical protein
VRASQSRTHTQTYTHADIDTDRERERSTRVREREIHSAQSSNGMCGPPIRTHVHALSERVCVCEREREACTFTSIAQIEARHEIVLGWLVLTGRGWTAADRRNVCAYLAVLCAETKCAFSQNAPKLLSLIVVSVPLCLCICMSASGVCVCVCGWVGGWGWPGRICHNISRRCCACSCTAWPTATPPSSVLLGRASMPSLGTRPCPPPQKRCVERENER